MAAKAYDATVARIAGNLASGIGPVALEAAIYHDGDRFVLARNCVLLARAIVEQTQATEPAPEAVKK